MRTPRLTAFDAAAIVWCVLAIVLGMEVTDRVRELRALPDAVTSVGGQVRGVGDALGGLDLPFVGDQLDRAADEIRSAGADAQAQGRDARTNVEAAASLLGFVVAFIPIAPVLAVYLPLRWLGLRDHRALRGLRARAAEDPDLDALLRRRELLTMSNARLARQAGRPWAEGT
jgi:hypothetical protein